MIPAAFIKKDDCVLFNILKHLYLALVLQCFLTLSLLNEAIYRDDYTFQCKTCNNSVSCLSRHVVCWCASVAHMCEQVRESSLQRANVCGSQWEWVTHNGTSCTSCTCHGDKSSSLKVSAIHLSQRILWKMTPVRETRRHTCSVCARALICFVHREPRALLC